MYPLFVVMLIGSCNQLLNAGLRSLITPGGSRRALGANRHPSVHNVDSALRPFYHGRTFLRNGICGNSTFVDVSEGPLHAAHRKLTVYHCFLGLSAEWNLGRLNICQCFRASSARSRSKNLLSITSVSAARSLKTSKDLSSLTDSETHASEISTFIYFSLPSLSAVLSSEPATFDSQPGTGPGRALARPAQGRFQHATFSVVMALTSLRLHLPESATDTYWRNIKYPVTVVT